MKRNIFLISNSEIKREGNVLKINDKKVPISIIDNIYIFGKTKITHSAQNLLLKNSKAIFYFDRRYNLTGILHSLVFNSNIRWKTKQYENMQNLDIAKYIVLKKIEEIEKFCNKSLNRYKEKLKEAASLSSVLGVEGSSSLYMFKKSKEELEKMKIYEFQKRDYHPVKDRVNGILSFLYTMYYSFLFAEVIKEEFDPYIGFLHIKRGRHAVFVSDMMEPARVKITEYALKILPQVYPNYFDGLYLNYEGRKIVCKMFGEFLQNYNNNLLKDIKEIL